MKYSFMTFSCPDKSLDEVLALAKNFGYDGVEPRVGSKHGHGIELTATAAARKKIRQRVADSRVALSCLATSCRYADPAAAEQQVKDTLAYIDLAADVGAPRLRVFGGDLPQGVTREQASGLLVKSLQSVAEQAKKRGVTVCIETHDSWCDPRELVAVVSRVNHPNIGINWDIMHPQRIAKMTAPDAFALLKPWVRHVHFHDGLLDLNKLQFKAVGAGEIDHRRPVALLLQAGYEGFLSGEWINWESCEVHLPRELAAMKGYEQEAVARN